MCYLEPSTSTYIKNLSRVQPTFAYILYVRLKEIKREDNITGLLEVAVTEGYMMEG